MLWSFVKVYGTDQSVWFQIYDEDGGVSSGTLEELIHELVPRAHSTPSENFQFAFLLSSRLFMTPTRLMVRTFSLASKSLPGAHVVTGSVRNDPSRCQVAKDEITGQVHNLDKNQVGSSWDSNWKVGLKFGGGNTWFHLILPKRLHTRDDLIFDI